MRNLITLLKTFGVFYTFGGLMLIYAVETDKEYLAAPLWFQFWHLSALAIALITLFVLVFKLLRD